MNTIITAPRTSLRMRVFSLAACLTLIVSAAHAQLGGKGAVSGTILDPTGATIPSATITITNTATGVAVTTTSTSAGDYTVQTLDAGVYTISVTAKGFQKLTQKSVQVNTLETQTFSPTMTVGSSDQEVTVSTLPPQLETTNATLGATMENDMYSALPIEMGAYGQPDQRRATDFVYLMPGVQGNETNGNATTNSGVVNGTGSRGNVSVVYIDGIGFVRAGNNGDPRFVWTAISVDAVDQFQVQTSGYSAQYEGEGIQNYTIKQGGNKFHGSLYEFFRNTALDTYGYFGKVPNPATGLVKKPIENSNEFGINLSGPLVPFGSWKDKVFFFGNYNGFRYASETPVYNTFPTLAEQQGNFSGVTQTVNNVTGPVPIYDPLTQAACAAANANTPCRNQYVGSQIPSSEFSQVALNMQKYIPKLTNQNSQNNYLAPNKTGLVNWSTTDRIDYIVSKKDALSFIAAIGRQASSVPVGQATSGRNVANVPYNYGQAYAPKTAVGIIEETHTFTDHLLNQFKYGYARYNGPTINADQGAAGGPFAATTLGISGEPIGQAQNAFPITTFAGTGAPTNWAGTTASVALAENYNLVDNLQWIKGKHTLTFGFQMAWQLYNNVNATTGSTPVTLANAVTETANINNKYTAVANTGLAYASFLVGEVDTVSFTQYLQQEFGSRWRPISPYVQDNFKVTDKLVLDLGLRWDYYPTVTEVHDAGAFFNPNLANPVTGANGALQYTGTGTNTCNCRTPVNNYFKNFGPRIGLAYQSDPKTVFRASFGIMYSHGAGTGGGATSLGTLGFSSSPKLTANGQALSSAPLTGTNGVLPSYAVATGRASGPAYGTGYTNVANYMTSPSSGSNYYDSYLGGRSPEYENWNFGFQHQWTSALATTISYVGTEGHFLATDGGNPRGLYANALDPKYLSIGTDLGDTGATLTAYCAAHSGLCPTYTPNFNANPNANGSNLATLLKPFPFQSVSDTFAYVGNSNYHALQASINMRPQHGLTFMANYTWSRAIDDGGTFRTGYAIPAGTVANSGASYAADRIERSVSTSNQPHHVVVTGVYELPFGKSILNSNAVERAVIGGFKLSEVYQAFSGSPLNLTSSSAGSNPAATTTMPTLNPNFSGSARINGKWGQGVDPSKPSNISYINPNAFITTPAYQFGNAPRTAPFNLYGPGNYNLDLALVRNFALKFTESARLEFRAEWFNVTNHTWFGVTGNSLIYGNSAFGTISGSNVGATRKSAQFDARISF